MNSLRQCSKPACTGDAVATMTFNQSDHMVVIGPLATRATPYSYDLCQRHVERFTPPIGWEIIRLQTKFDPAPEPVSVADPEALVRAVQAASKENLDERPQNTLKNEEQAPETQVEHSPSIAPVIELAARLDKRENDTHVSERSLEYGPFAPSGDDENPLNV